jgi:hypothetical protein
MKQKPKLKQKEKQKLLLRQTIKIARRQFFPLLMLVATSLNLWHGYQVP